VLRVLILVLALGFPLALVLAWAIDLTPEGRASCRAAPAGSACSRFSSRARACSRSAGMCWAAGLARGRTWPRESSRGQGRSYSGAVDCVLPFVNMSGDPANDYFSDGLAETTLDMLAQVHDLKVIARTSSFAFKGKPDDVREIGRKLDAAHLLEGSVQQSGKTVRITAQLVRTSDGAHVWSHRYDRQLTDVFKIQDEIADRGGEARCSWRCRRRKPRASPASAPTMSAAYQEYLRGVALMPGRRVPDMRRALAHFQRAIALDPEVRQGLSRRRA
jgi:TolB-like protein